MENKRHEKYVTMNNNIQTLWKINFTYANTKLEKSLNQYTMDSNVIHDTKCIYQLNLILF